MKKLIISILIFITATLASAQCETPQGALSWDRPENFNPLEDTILIFAKKYINDSITYINIGVPTKPPGTYGVPDTILTKLDASIAPLQQYENDPLAMLIYADTGECVEFTGSSTDTTYFFAIFNVDSGSYSNARYALGKLSYSIKVTNILALVNRIQWAPIIYYDTAMVIIKQGSAPVGVPSGPAAGYLTGVNTDYSQSTSYFNGTDATDGKILYVNTGNRFTLLGLSGFSYTVRIYTITDGCWGQYYDVVLDNIPDE